MPSIRSILKAATLALAIPAAVFGVWTATTAAEAPVVIPAPLADLPAAGSTATAVFAGGCFWGVQGVFQHVKGVTNAVSGYSGGGAAEADYKTVSAGITRHAEAVEVTYDPSEVSYGELLHIYFSVAHNPTQLNYQGPDYGTQYRSTIFYASEEQKQVAEQYIAQLEGAKVYEDKIVTTLEPLQAFYPAEQYHQDYLTLNPSQPYIFYNDLPKLAALKQIFPAVWRDEPRLVGQLAQN